MYPRGYLYLIDTVLIWTFKQLKMVTIEGIICLFLNLQTSYSDTETNHHNRII